jgi:peptidyl-tRNA hydrolase, PTH1 family
MKHVIVGLGNPGEEYKDSRHNTGRTLLESFAKKNDFFDFDNDKRSQALVSKGRLGKQDVVLVLPETFMNKSGRSALSFVTSKKAAERCVVVYDDIDLPLGTIKITFGRGSGGHRGVESVIKSLKTKDFVRIRVGVSPATPKGKVKKPKGDGKVLDFLMGDFRKSEKLILKKVSKQVNDALIVLIEEGRAQAMNKFN